MRAWGLAEQAATMGLELSADAVAQLNELLQLLAKWNRVYNLTAISTDDKLVSHHLLLLPPIGFVGAVSLLHIFGFVIAVPLLLILFTLGSLLNRLCAM